MSAFLQTLQTSLICPVETEIRMNAAWLGQVSGIKAEKMLRGHNKSYLYVLREGEKEGDYYVTFVQPNGSIYHQPFTISKTAMGWMYEQGNSGPISMETKLNDVLHLIMHCEKHECQPLGC